MDTSKQYTEMCSKAKGIQSSWVPKLYDKIYAMREIHTVKSFGVAQHRVPDCFKEDTLQDLSLISVELVSWLSRQDQLQAIISNDLNKLVMVFF